VAASSLCLQNGTIDSHGVSDSGTDRKTAERVFLATSHDVPGLIAQGRTVAEALDIARDVARKLIEARRERF